MTVKYRHTDNFLGGGSRIGKAQWLTPLKLAPNLLKILALRPFNPAVLSPLIPCHSQNTSLPGQFALTQSHPHSSSHSSIPAIFFAQILSIFTASMTSATCLSAFLSSYSPSISLYSHFKPQPWVNSYSCFLSYYTVCSSAAEENHKTEWINATVHTWFQSQLGSSTSLKAK